MDLTTVAVPHTLAHVKPLLPAPPARVLEVGCGRGALAAALVDLGFKVTGVDRDAEMATAARERGVRVIQADVHDVSGEYDVVLFTRSLHHAESLDDVLAHAATLLAPGGQVVIEEFAWEQVDHAVRISSTTTARCWSPPACSTPNSPPVTCSTPGLVVMTSSTEAPP